MKYIVKGTLFALLFSIFLFDPFTTEKASAACGYYEIDSNDPNWYDSYDGDHTGWGYHGNVAGSFRGDYMISGNSTQTVDRFFEWGDYYENYKICGTTATLSVYLNNINFVDPDAEYYATTSIYSMTKVATVNQELAGPKWNSIAYIGSSFAPLPITLRSYGRNGATGADGIAITAN